ncbi:MAG TPA: hypothetical protein VEZ44_04430 [bacterium]|nr:hypothetical protein [bacterium]
MCSVGIPEFDVLDDGGCVVLLPEGGTISGTATGDLHFCAGLSAKPQANVANAHPVRDGG